MAILTRRPIVSKITDNLVETLNAVKKSAGYENDFVAEKFKRTGNDAAHGKVVVAKVEFEPTEGQPVGATKLWQYYQITCYVAEDETGEVAFDDLCDVAAADVMRSVMSDFQRDNKAYLTEFVRGEPFDDSESDMGGVLMTFRVQYRTKLDNLYEQ